MIGNDIKILFRSWRLPADETLQVADPKDKNEEVSCVVHLAMSLCVIYLL